MNYDQARQVDPNADRPDAGKWRYTSMNDGQVWAVGYCAESCPGHDTREEAYEHQTAYMLDRELDLDGRYSDTQRRCEAPVGQTFTPDPEDPASIQHCDAWTDRFATFRLWGPSYSLCDEHRTKSVVAGLFGIVGDSIHS